MAVEVRQPSFEEELGIESVALGWSGARKLGVERLQMDGHRPLYYQEGKCGQQACAGGSIVDMRVRGRACTHIQPHNGEGEGDKHHLIPVMVA